MKKTFHRYGSRSAKTFCVLILTTVSCLTDAAQLSDDRNLQVLKDTLERASLTYTDFWDDVNVEDLDGDGKNEFYGTALNKDREGVFYIVGKVKDQYKLLYEVDYGGGKAAEKY